MTEPLLPLVDPHTATPAQAAFLASGPPAAIQRLFAHAPELAEGMMVFGKRLHDPQSSGLPPQLREAVIIRTARVRGSPYVEDQHRRVGAALGLSDARLDAAAEGSGADHLDEAWRSPMRLVEAALDGRAADPADITAIEADLGRPAILALLMVSGLFGIFAGVSSALGLVEPAGGR